MKVLVIGGGKSGKAAKKMFEARGDDVELAEGQYDFAVVSPGVAVFSELDIAFRYARFDKVVAVTGTNGKTSTVTMIHRALGLAGRESVLCGNVGVPACDVVAGSFSKFLVPAETRQAAEKLQPIALKQSSGLRNFEKEPATTSQIAVVEVSSFQLEIPPRWFRPDISVILNITQDHLDRHGSMAEYERCKRRIDARQWGGVHFENLGNGDAVRAVCRELGIAEEFAERAIEEYYAKPQPHRLELVCEIDGVRYINDSKATNIASTLFACEKFDAPIHLIVGGVAKGQDFAGFGERLPRNVVGVYVIGRARDAILGAVASTRDKAHIRSCFDACTLDRAVEIASERARDGDVVILSPACASFDMFRNYEHRGEEFRRIVTQKKPG